MNTHACKYMYIYNAISGLVVQGLLLENVQSIGAISNLRGDFVCCEQANDGKEKKQLCHY